MHLNYLTLFLNLKISSFFIPQLKLDILSKDIPIFFKYLLNKNNKKIIAIMMAASSYPHRHTNRKPSCFFILLRQIEDQIGDVAELLAILKLTLWKKA